MFRLAVLAVLGASSRIVVADPSPRDQLRVIVQEQCLPHWLAGHSPSPCERVRLPATDALEKGYAVLHDRKGGAHFLLIPTRTIRGIEDPTLLAGATPNYFDAAWQNRDLLAQDAGPAFQRDAIGMALNHVQARSQDQLHIHLSCVGPAIHETLRNAAGRIGYHWATIQINDRPYFARRVDGESLDGANPVALLAAELDGAASAMADYTLLVTGMSFDEGPGFVLLAGTTVPSAERLLDASCAVAGHGP